jgi:hypothetical protein
MREKGGIWGSDTEDQGRGGPAGLPACLCDHAVEYSILERERGVEREREGEEEHGSDTNVVCKIRCPTTLPCSVDSERQNEMRPEGLGSSEFVDGSLTTCAHMGCLAHLPFPVAVDGPPEAFQPATCIRINQCHHNSPHRFPFS